MKKVFFLLLILSILVFISSKARTDKKSQLSNLILKNIECLATPESPSPRCYGIGSVDCPYEYSNVIIYYNEEI